MRKLILSVVASGLLLTSVCACTPKNINDADVKEVANTYITMLSTATSALTAGDDKCNKFVADFGKYINESVSDNLDANIASVAANDEKMRSALYLLGLSSTNPDDFAALADACKDNENFTNLITAFNQSYTPFNEATKKFSN